MGFFKGPDTCQLNLGQTMPYKLLLHHRIVLLSLNDTKGTFTGSYCTYATAGAMISELLLQNRITADKDKKKTVSVISQDPTGDEFLDELLKQMSESGKPRGLQDWVTRAAGIKHLAHRIAEQLSQMGILKQDEKKVLWVFSRQVYPELDGTVEDNIRDQMARVMFDPKVIPDEPTAILIALASHADLLKANFVPEELRQHRQRVKQLAAGEILASAATQQAIAAVQAAVLVAVMLPAIITVTTR